MQAASGEPAGKCLVGAGVAQPQLPHVERADDERRLDLAAGTPFLCEDRGAHRTRIEGDEEFGLGHLTGLLAVEREAHPQGFASKPHRPAGIDPSGRAEPIFHLARLQLPLRGHIPGIDRASVGQGENQPHRLAQELGLRAVAALGVEAELGDDRERCIGAEVVDCCPCRGPVAPGVRGLRDEVSKLGRRIKGVGGEGHARRVSHFRAGDRAQQLGNLFGNIPCGHALPAVARTHELPVRRNRQRDRGGHLARGHDHGIRLAVKARDAAAPAPPAAAALIEDNAPRRKPRLLDRHRRLAVRQRTPPHPRLAELGGEHRAVAHRDLCDPTLRIPRRHSALERASLPIVAMHLAVITTHHKAIALMPDDV